MTWKITLRPTEYIFVTEQAKDYFVEQLKAINPKYDVEELK